ncbi:YpiF family protein [Peribacillus sp. SCS-155]|uniref:YpiF family protein n=1 Tax=Peribacillus sedimenti TaxID=3115297 RepID=UPI003906BF8D
MRWTPKEIDAFNQAKEYIDTIMIPLIPVSIDQDMKQSASIHNFINILTMSVEQQFRGRILLMPQLSYLSSSPVEDKLGLVRSWKQEASGFKHVLFITSDIEWKRHEGVLGGSLLWIPSMPLEHLADDQARTLVNDQVRQLSDVFSKMWSK